jgi:peptide/nickel transport system permease protein
MSSLSWWPPRHGRQNAGGAVSIFVGERHHGCFSESILMKHLFAVAGRRILALIPALLVILAGFFLLLRLAPGDTVDALLAQIGGADPVMIQELRRYYEVDQTAGTRLLGYLSRLCRLDLGQSAIYGKPVAGVILERLPATLSLMGSALALALTGGLLLGVLAARRVNRWQDTLISILTLAGYSTPIFWFGLMLILIFAIRLAWLPAGGFGSIEADLHGWEKALDAARYLVLPTATLSLFYLAVYLRLMRASMLEVMGLDFVRAARAKGLPEKTILGRHVLRNALLPVITLAGLQAGSMVGGAVVVESVFTLPGMGRLAYESVVQRDLNTLLGVVFVSALVVAGVNLLVDLFSAKLDPRIQATR